MRLAGSFIHLFCCVAGILLPLASQACQCGPVPSDPTLLQAFQSSDVVVQATLLKQLNTSGFDVTYSAQIIRAWKGCSNFKGAATTTITTATQESLCGVIFLKPGTTYLLSGSFSSSKKSLLVNSCEFQAAWNRLSSAQHNQVETLSKTYSNCTCTTKSCGARPNTPNFLCPDGVTIGGPGKCSYNQKLGACAWETVQCPTCQKESDCPKGQFCSRGKCRADGTCAIDADCFNPQNHFIKNCTGAPRCLKSKCVVDCSQACPGSNDVRCLVDACTVTSCKVPHASCASNYCGGCHALFYNSSGYQVCNTK